MVHQRISIYFSFIIVFFSLLPSAFAQEYKFNLQVLQGGKIIKPNELVYHLKSKPISLQIEANNLNGFLVGATFDEDVYKSALGVADLEVNWFEETGMAEELFNSDKSMFVSNDAPSYWYYISKDDHRFDKDPKSTNSGWVGVKTINSLYDIVNGSDIDLKSFKKSIYLFIYKPYYNNEHELENKDVLFHAELRFK